MLNEIKRVINNDPLQIKHVVISRDTWEKIRPIIKDLQKSGLYYDVSEYYNKIYLRVLVNPETQKFIESLL